MTVTALTNTHLIPPPSRPSPGVSSFLVKFSFPPPFSLYYPNEICTYLSLSEAGEGVELDKLQDDAAG